MNQYDVIVVGGGNGGLVAAATTAKAGYKTLLLERHNIPGGSASSFRRGRFEFEPSLHELCSVGTKEDPQVVYEIFDRLGADINWAYDSNILRAIVTGEDGYDVRLHAGIDNLCDDIERAVPGSRESVKRFFDLIEKNDAALAYIYKMKGNPNPLTMVFKHPDFMRTACHSVEDIQIALGMPEKARYILNTYWGYLGIPTDDLNALHYLSMVGSYVKDGATMPKKRSHELSLALEKAITDKGGEVWYNSEVTKFLYEEGRCVGVALGDGTELYAKEIISNVIPNNVYEMSGEENVPLRERKLASARNFGMTFVTVYLGLDCTKEDLGIEDYTVFKMACPNPREQFDRRNECPAPFYVVNCLNVVIPNCSPQGTSMLFFTIPAFGNELPEDLTPENYKEWKNAVAKAHIEDYERTMGMDIMSHIEEIEIATPVTFARYLGTPEGEIYGYNNEGWDNVVMRANSEAKDFTVPGLTYCGGHASRGDGYSSAYITGEMAGQKVIRKLQTKEVK